MARKSMIVPGSILPTLTDDMMSRIVSKDRERAGRAAPKTTIEDTSENAQTESEVTEEETPVQPVIEAELTSRNSPSAPGDNIRSNITSNITANKESNTRTKQYANEQAQKTARTRSGTSPLPEGSDYLAFIHKHAEEMARTRLIPMTLRIPEELNDWLDEYAHDHRKEGVKKQSLISRAVQLLYIELAGAEEL